MDSKFLEINPGQMPTLPMTERNYLPSIRCIYFVVSEGKVLYIGSTKNLKARWVNHHRYPHLTKLSPGIAWIGLADNDDMLAIENFLIQKFTPQFNGIVERRNKVVVPPNGYISWNLRQLMARYKIKAVDLATELGIHENSVSRMRNAGKMPRVDGQSLDSLLKALDKLSGTRINLVDLIKRVRE